MNDPKMTWRCILQLAEAIAEAGTEPREQEQLALAKLVLNFHRDVVKHPLRERAAESSQDGTSGVERASSQN